MFNQDGLNEALALDALYADTFDATHSSQESWSTRDRVQKSVWSRMINDLVVKLSTEPVFWGSTARYIDPKHIALVEPRGAAKIVAFSLDEHTQYLLEQLLTAQNSSTDLLRKIVENTARARTVSAAQDAGMRER